MIDQTSTIERQFTHGNAPPARRAGGADGLILSVPQIFPGLRFFMVARGKRVVEASKFVDPGKCLDRKARLLISSLFLVSLGLLAGTSAHAQSASPQLQTPPPAAAPVQTPAERARILRDAQARINARREARVQQIINETYGHKFEAYGGAGYLRFHPGPDKQRNEEAAWNIGITDYIRPRLGITADVRGYYGTAYIGNNPYGVFKPSISQYAFLFGPQYRVYAKPKFAVSLQALAGFGHGNFDTGTGGLPASFIGLYNNSTAFNMSLGVPLDYNLGPGLAIRLTPLYFLTTYGSEAQNNLGFNVGVVYRFGKR
jgi:hypothetical protein